MPDHDARPPTPARTQSLDHFDEAERAAMKRLGEILREHRDRFACCRRKVFRDYFVHERPISEERFHDLIRPADEAQVDALIAGDIEGLCEIVRGLGHKLVDNRIPYPQLLVWDYLLRDCFRTQCGGTIRSLENVGDDIVMVAEHVGQLRLMLLAEAYFDTHLGDARRSTRHLERELSRFAASARERTYFHGLIGGTLAMRRLYERIERVAVGRGNALVIGETGTGKELVARALHAIGDPPGASFVPVNCAALPSELIESELFGHRAGAFTGARGASEGLVRAAHEGTLFLDEITEMQPHTQAKLLRVIQEGRVRPVGGTDEIDVDVRIVASSNRGIDEALASGRLREDLYYRLRVHTLRVPPLRDRIDDVAPLCDHYLALYGGRYRRRVEGIEDEALAALRAHSWPGNVRELMGVMESAVAYGSSSVVTLADLPLEDLVDTQRRDPNAESGEVVTFEESERSLLERALEATDGNKSQAARMLGISRKQLYAKLRKFELG